MPSSELDSLVLDWLFCILDRSSLLTYLVSDGFLLFYRFSLL